MKAVILVFFLTLGTHAAWSQTVASTPVPTPVVDARAAAKDSLSQDPSAQPQLQNFRVIPQKELAKKGIGELIRGGILIEWFQEIFPRYPHLIKKHPEWFDLLQIHQDRYQPRAENGPAAVNADFEFEGISDKKFGYCWGFATLLRNFLTLAFYDPSLPRLENSEDYEDLIQKIANGKPAVIPGFANLREMSLVPEIELLLKLRAMKLWQKAAIRSSSVGLYLKTAHRMNLNSAMNLVDRLDQKLKQGELPKIIFSSRVAVGGFLKLSKYIHVVLVNGVERTPEGGARIKIWDVNFFAETLQKSPKYIEITPDGDLIYEPWFEPGTEYEADSRYLSRISLAPENNRETAKMVTQLHHFCSQPENQARCIPAVE
jgi:hypothetical protein